MSNGTDIGIYGNGLFQETLFQVTPVSYQEQLDQLAPAAFTWLVLWAWHVQPNGDIHYNSVPAVVDGQLSVGARGLNPDLPALLSQLRELSRIERVGLSLGGDQSTFQEYVIPNLDRVLEGLAALTEFLSADAIDFDFEPIQGYSDAYKETIVTVTNRVADLGLAVTYCPSGGVDWWPGVLAAVAQERGDQPVAAINVQLYGGGPAAAEPWVSALQQTPHTGIPDVNSFLVPGYWVANNAPMGVGQCPSSIEATFAKLSPSTLTSGWLWNSGWIFEQSLQQSLCPNQSATPADYADAIANGLAANAASNG